MDPRQVGLGATLLAASGAILLARGVPGGHVPLSVAALALVGLAARSARTGSLGGRRPT